MPQVVILLSTYDGERYLEEQLDSVLGQSHAAWLLHVRDDGSRDGTVAILERYARRDSRIHLACGENVGVVSSFLRLLADAPADADAFAFCDQDDVWRPDRLRHALERLGSAAPGRPALYASRLEFVDARLRRLGLGAMPRRPGFENALVQNVATGCTQLFNRAARDLLLTALPERAIIHDWWVYLVVSAFGSFVFDERPHVLYRQHGANVIGGTASKIESLRRRWARFAAGGRGVFRPRDQAEEFRRAFGARLDPRRSAVLDRFVDSNRSLRSRAAYALRMDVRRDSALDTALLRLLILLGRY